MNMQTAKVDFHVALVVFQIVIITKKPTFEHFPVTFKGSPKNVHIVIGTGRIRIRYLYCTNIQTTKNLFLQYRKLL